MWDFETEPEFKKKLDWMMEFVTQEIEPLEVIPDLTLAQYDAIIAPLRDEVRGQQLWACHLPPELGGQGYGQVKLALMNEILGRTVYAPEVFGTAAPDSGNAEILALYGTDEQKRLFLEPLLAGKMRSAFSQTEPGAGADPTLIESTAQRDGDEWVINGHKWFTSQASISQFLIVACKTNASAPPRESMSFFIVPTDTPGVTLVRDIPTMGGYDRAEGFIGHGEILYDDVRVPAGNLLGGEGEGFIISQKRLGPGRIHHCMRWLGQSARAFDMLCERALSRYVHGSLLAEKQTIQNWIADSYAELQATRLLTLQAAWQIDRGGSSSARKEISLIKFWGAAALHNVIDRALQVHGSLGFSADLPLEWMYRLARSERIADGPDEVHRMTVARQVLKGYDARPVPSEHVPTRRGRALAKYSALFESEAANV